MAGELWGQKLQNLMDHKGLKSFQDRQNQDRYHSRMMTESSALIVDRNQHKPDLTFLFEASQAQEYRRFERPLK